jgi:hypothetical protein
LSTSISHSHPLQFAHTISVHFTPSLQYFCYIQEKMVNSVGRDVSGVTIATVSVRLSVYLAIRNQYCYYWCEMQLPALLLCCSMHLLCIALAAHICTYACAKLCTLTEVFPCSFLSCKANARVMPAKTGHGPHSS